MRTSTKTILLLSGFLLVSDLTFVLINYRSGEKALEASAERLGQNATSSFYRTLESNIASMQMIATYVANNPIIEDLFSKGRDAVLREGGGAGGPVADSLRKALYNYLKPSWDTMTHEFEVRQLHFHLGPGSLSFLRVHKPEKFGDRMDEVRYTVVDVNKYSKTVGGFETGRVYSGVRGVVPVIKESNKPGGKEKLIGALEAGNSFTTILQQLKAELNADLAVFLTKDHIEDNVWPQFRDEYYPKGPAYNNHYLETCTCDEEDPRLNDPALLSMLGTSGTKLLSLPGDHKVSTTAIPLRDYRGTYDDPSLPPVGTVVVFQNFNQEYQSFANAMRVNIIFALIGYIIAEILIVVVIRFISRSLQTTIDRQAEQLKTAYEESLEHEKEREHFNTVKKLAATVAHEFNNPLAVIQGNCELYSQDPSSKDRIEKAFDAINRQTDKMAGLVRKLMNLEKVSEKYYAGEMTIYDLDNS